MIIVTGSVQARLERWADRDALRTHFGVPESGAFVNAASSLAAGTTTLEIYDAPRVEL